MDDEKNPDPFDPASLRLSQDFGAEVGVKKHLARVPVRKPIRQDFVRVNPSEEYRLDTAVLELKEDREVYLVAPDMREELFSEIYPVRLYTYINRQGIVALWPCRLPGFDGRTNPWHETAHQAAELAMERWVRIVADMSLGGYQPYIAAADLPDPEWPDHPFEELLRIAFGNLHIDRPDHPVLTRLQGLQ
jgi:hypothetical protein